MHCLSILIGYFVLDVEGIEWNLVENSLNALPGLSLFTLVFIRIFSTWSMGAHGFRLSFSVFFNEFFSLSVLSRQIGDSYKSYFVRYFALLVVNVGVVDTMYGFAWTTSLDLFILNLLSRCLLKFDRE